MVEVVLNRHRLEDNDILRRYSGHPRSYGLLGLSGAGSIT